MTISRSKVSPHILTRLAPAVPSEVYDTYWKFAVERQDIFFRRFEKQKAPWTNDSILKQHKFTNAYRASDRVSQYLIRNVIYRGDPAANEVFFRIMLFKVFNKIETWELLKNQLGSISYADYSFKAYSRILSSALEKGLRIFSAAYIMPSGCSSFGHRQKHKNLLHLIQLMMDDNVPEKLTETRSMQAAYELLKTYPMLGDFLAYQLVTDINYSELTHFTEMEFVVPGPGARNGIHKCFKSLGGLREVEIIKFMADRQEHEFEQLELVFRSLWGRSLQLIDCQNLFCEVDKYSRVRHPEVEGLSKRKKIKQRLRPNLTPVDYWYPPKWGINEHIVLSNKRASNIMEYQKKTQNGTCLKKS